jgi:hypothetical protein
VKAVLVSNIPELEVEGIATPETTGAFEVVDKKTRKVYFSKLGGQGYLEDNVEALKLVVEAIKADRQ